VGDSGAEAESKEGASRSSVGADAADSKAARENEPDSSDDEDGPASSDDEQDDDGVEPADAKAEFVLDKKSQALATKRLKSLQLPLRFGSDVSKVFKHTGFSRLIAVFSPTV